LVVLLALALLLQSCVAPGGAGRETDPAPQAPPEDWPEKVAAALREKYPAAAPAVFFTAAPRPSRLRYHYWTERRFTGLAGLAVSRSRTDGPWESVYVIGPEGEIDFLSGRLDWIEVDPPLYRLEVVDQTKGRDVRLVRIIDLPAETEEALRDFMTKPFEELTGPYVLP
jgi:hypothetical protein